jgi:hypothetical protein
LINVAVRSSNLTKLRTCFFTMYGYNGANHLPSIGYSESSLSTVDSFYI